MRYTQKNVIIKNRKKNSSLELYAQTEKAGFDQVLGMVMAGLFLKPLFFCKNNEEE